MHATGIRAPFPILTADEAAAMINHGQTIGVGGFTPPGSPKAIPLAISRRALAEHAAGRDFQIGIVSGASSSDATDGALAKAKAIKFRTPYQQEPTIRAGINAGEIPFFDMHLSVTPQIVRYGFLGPLHWAIVEACDVTADGVVLTSSVGSAPSFCAKADGILIELNRRYPTALFGMHDIYVPADPPYRREIPIYAPSDRAGSTVMKLDGGKFVGIVETDLEDQARSFDETTPETETIGNLVAEFLADEIKAGRIPASFLPIQSGGGNIANAALGALGKHPRIPRFNMYTEVAQDAVLELILAERVLFASTCSLTLSRAAQRRFYQELNWFRSRILMRPTEISNNPEVIRRLGVIAIQTGAEIDIFGNVNSTHIMGQQMLNGIGGSGDFAQNAYLSIFTSLSTARDGKISRIVPLVSHIDHTEHAVQVVATEWGLADLRGLSPFQRARSIIENCAHPDFRDPLRTYLNLAKRTHTPQTLGAAFAFHDQFLRTKDMHGVSFSKAE